MSSKSSFLSVAMIALLTVSAAFAGAGGVPASVDLSWSNPATASTVGFAYEDPGSSLPLYDHLDWGIDQNQPSNSGYIGAFYQTGLAQSFQQTNANICGAGICLHPDVGTSDLVTIQVWTNLPNAGGTMLAESGTTGTAGNWVDVFWTPVDVTPGTTYYLVFTGNITLGITGEVTNPYPNGMAYANPGYTPYPSYDYAFRTYYFYEFALECDTWAGVKSSFL